MPDVCKHSAFDRVSPHQYDGYNTKNKTFNCTKMKIKCKIYKTAKTYNTLI